MADEFDYASIIADPNLMDPEYDISNIRTTTPTSQRLLADVPEYSGLKYDPTQRSYLEDLYSLYSGGLPTIPVEQTPVDTTPADTTPVDTGGGGGGNLLDQLETDAGIDTPINVDTPLTQMVTDPTTGQTQTVRQAMTTDDAYRGVDTTMPPMLDQTGQMGMDSFVDTTPDYSNVGSEGNIKLAARGTPISEMGTRPPDFVAGAQTFTDPDPSARIDARGTTVTGTTPPDFVAGITTLTEPQPGAGDVRGFSRDRTTDQVDQSMSPQLGDTGASMDYMSGALDAPYGVNPDTGVPYETPRSIADQNAILGQTFTEPATTLGSQINSAFENVKAKGTAGIEELKNNLVALGGKVKEGFENIVDFGDTQIDVGKTLATGALNYLGKSIFGPVGAILGTALQALPEGGRGDVSDALGEKYGMDDIGRLTGGPMAGYSVGPNHAQTVQDRIDSIKNRTAPQTEASEKKIAELEAYKAEVIAAGSSGVITEPGTVLGPGEFLPEDEDLVTAEDLAAEERKEGLKELSDIYSGIGQTRDAPTGQDKTPSGPTGQDIHGGDGPSQDSAPSAPSGGPYGGGPGGIHGGETTSAPTGISGPPGRGGTATTGPSGPPSQGGGGSSGGGKIVCTMMNDSYGFGSFRNKIWLRHSKDLAPEYQIGYHKIFLPLVRLSKTNKLLKKTLEHIAVHRTIDIRQEARGKVHLLGRIYRKILEPICYWVGKYAKR